MRVAKSGSDSGSGTSGIGASCSRPVLGHLEARLQVEDRLPVLDGDHPAGGEGAAVADAVDLVEDRHVRVAGPQEVGVERVDAASGLHRAGGGHQRLARPPGRRTPAGGPRRARSRGRCSPRSARGRAASPARRRPPGTSGHPRVRTCGYGPAPWPDADAFPTGSDGGPPPPPTRSRAGTSTTTGGAGSTPRLRLQGVERRLLRQLAPLARGRRAAPGARVHRLPLQPRVEPDRAGRGRVLQRGARPLRPAVRGPARGGHRAGGDVPPLHDAALARRPGRLGARRHAASASPRTARRPRPASTG